MSKVDLGGFALNTRIDGEDGAPWIVLSNSLGANLSMWDDQIALLTRGFRVLRYDTRGHGQSDAPNGPYTLDQLEGDVIALMDHFGISTACYMGLSMGAMVGMGLAVRHPDRFERMILADGRADAPPAFKQMWDDRIATLRKGGLEAIVEGTLAGWFTEDWRDENPDRVAQVRAMVLGSDLEGYIACCRALQGLDVLKDLHKITLPAMYIGGSNDMGAPPEVMQAMADATPGADYIEIANAAHVANINRTSKFNAAIGSFLGI